MTSEPAFGPAELAACRALIDGLDEAMGYEVSVACVQQELFPDREPLGPAGRVALRAFVAAANLDSSEEPLLDGTALLAALEFPHHPPPEHPVFRCPGRVERVERLLRGFGATGPFRSGHGSKLACRLAAFAYQGTMALQHAKGAHPFGLPEDCNLPPVSDRAKIAFARLRAKMFHELVVGPECGENGRSSAVTAFGCVRLVLDPELREARLEVRRSDLTWSRSPASWVLEKPFQSLHWLDTLLDVNAGVLIDAGGRPLGDNDVSAIRKRLGEEAQRSGLLQLFEAATKSWLRLDATLLATARAMSPSWGPCLTCADHYTAAWRTPQAWDQAVRENAELAPLLYVLCRERTVDISDGFRGLKLALLAEGIGRNGWKQLCTQGRQGYVLALQYASTWGRPQVDFVAKFVAFQGRLSVDGGGALPEALVRSIFRNTLVVLRIAKLRLPSRLLALAVAEYARQSNEEDRTRFIGDEWQPLLSWFAQAEPKIHANQWSGGWVRLKRAAWDWTRRRLAEDGPPEWTPGIASFTRLAHYAVPLVSKAQLEVDGIFMAHCVAQYADSCRIRGYKLFSVRRVEGNRRVATIGIKMGEDGWEVDQVRRRCNQEGDESLWRFAFKLAHRMNHELQGSDPG